MRYNVVLATVAPQKKFVVMGWRGWSIPHPTPPSSVAYGGLGILRPTKLPPPWPRSWLTPTTWLPAVVSMLPSGHGNGVRIGVEDDAERHRLPFGSRSALPTQ